MRRLRIGIVLWDRMKRLPHCSQLHIRQAKRNVDARRTLHRPWLQSHGISRAANQEVFADTDADTNISAGAYVIAGKTSRHHLVGRREYAPGQSAAGREAEIYAQRGHAAGIEFGRATDFRGKAALHPLKTDDNQTNGRGDIAVENAHLRARPT